MVCAVSRSLCSGGMDERVPEKCSGSVMIVKTLSKPMLLKTLLISSRGEIMDVFLWKVSRVYLPILARSPRLVLSRLSVSERSIRIFEKFLSAKILLMKASRSPLEL